MAKMNLNSKDILLLLLYTPIEGDSSRRIVGRTRVTKLMFIFQKEIFKKFQADSVTLKEVAFKSYNFGPWSKDIYDDLEFLSNVGFIEAIDSEEEALAEEAEEFDLWENGLSNGEVDVDEFSQQEFQLSKIGTKFVEENLWALLSDRQKEILVQFKTKFNAVPLYALLRYVYNNYDEYTDKSIIRGKVLGGS